MVSWLVNHIKACCSKPKGYIYLQKCNLVNVKQRWAKDWELDEAVVGQKELRAACILVFLISSSPEAYVPIYRLRKRRRQLDIPEELKLSAFIRRYPSIFHESYFPDSAGTHVPYYGLTPEATSIRDEELNVLEQNKTDLVNRLCKLLMLMKHTTLPLQTIDQFKWDLGLPFDYHESLVPSFPDLFSFVKLEDDRVGLKLLSWNNELAISHLQKNFDLSEDREGIAADCLPFPIGFTRGFGFTQRYTRWLNEWQKLPYTSPYSDASHLDPRTDVSEKRIVGAFHELLHLTIHKQTQRKNVSNIRKPLGLPQKFTKVFERHPGIFYISMKSALQTVVLREAFNGPKLVEKHPLVEIRRKYKKLMEKGFLDKSRGLSKKAEDVEDPCI